MTNLEAVQKMDKDSFEAFLDQVYVTGINTGSYAQTLTEDDANEVLDRFPFNKEWLDDEAEPAVLHIIGEDAYMLRALCKIVMEAAGIYGGTDEVVDTAKIE